MVIGVRGRRRRRRGISRRGFLGGLLARVPLGVRCAPTRCRFERHPAVLAEEDLWPRVCVASAYLEGAGLIGDLVTPGEPDRHPGGEPDRSRHRHERPCELLAVATPFVEERLDGVTVVPRLDIEVVDEPP